MTHEFFQLLLNGLVTGSVLAIAAVGVTLTYGLLRIANFAQGDFLTIGAFVAFAVNVSAGQSIVVATLAAIVAVAALSVGLEYAFWRPLRRRGTGFLGLFLGSLGLALVLRYTIFLAAGSTPRSLAVDPFAVDSILGLRLSRSAWIGLLITLVAIAAVGALLAYTTVGRSIRAVADDRDLASVSGVDPNRVTVQSWLVSGGLAGLAGVIQALALSSFDPNTGGALVLAMFAAAILGGIGNPYGALVAGLVVGIVMELSTWEGFAGGVDPRYKQVVVFCLLAAALVVRPHGLFGRARLQ